MQQLQLESGMIVGGRYELKSPLGSGGMGWVFEASDNTLDQQAVALKFLYPHLLSEGASFSRFRNEVLVARKLIHPNIVRTYNMGVDGGQAYIVMEYIQGLTLKSTLKTLHPTGMDETAAALMALEIARGIDHSHSLGIIHRDIKPDNVLISSDGTVKLSDFGLAATFRRQSKLTRTGQLLGTPYYMSPEQFRGEPPDQRSDLYAFGILLYELLFGQVPFSDSSLFGLAMKHTSEKLVIPPGHRHRISPALWQTIERAAHKLPAERHSSCAELIAELEQIVGVQTPHAVQRTVAAEPAVLNPDAPVELPPYDVKWIARRVTLPVIILTLVIGTIWTRFNQSAQTRVTVALLFFEKQLGIFPEPLYTLFDISPDFRDKPLAAISQNEAWPRVYLGEDPDAPENLHPDHGRSFLYVSTSILSLRMIDFLLKHGASPATQAHDGSTPLHMAVTTGDFGITEQFLKTGMNSNVSSLRGETALHIAVKASDTAIAGLLMKYGADPLRRDKDGWNAVMYAFDRANVDVIRALLEPKIRAQLAAEDLKNAPPRSNRATINTLLRELKVDFEFTDNDGVDEG